MSIREFIGWLGLWLTVALLTWWAAPAQADVLIAVAAGGGGEDSWAHNESQTITGTGFGTKSPAGPLVWDNFESGSDGSAIENQAPTVENMPGTWTWGITGNMNNDPVYETTAPGGRSGTVAFFDCDQSGWYMALVVDYAMTDTGDEAFYNNDVYYEQNTGYSRNYKPFIVYGTGNSDMPLSYTGFGNPDDDDGNLRTSTQDQGSSVDDAMWHSINLDTDQEDKWLRHQIYLKQSANNVANGVRTEHYHKYSGTKDITREVHDGTHKTRNTSNYWNNFFFGCTYHDNSPATSRGYIYVDNLYIDSTRRRVEVCDTTTFSSSSPTQNHCAVQIPTAWSATSITVTTNKGQFSTNDTAYVFVIDADDNPVQQGGNDYVMEITWE